MTTKFNNWDVSETHPVEVGAHLLNALLEGGQSYGQGVQRRKLWDSLKEDEEEATSQQREDQLATQEMENPGKTGAQEAAGKPPRIKWRKSDLLADPQEHFKRARRMELLGDKKGAQVEKEAANRASIDAKEYRKANLTRGQENTQALNNARKAGMTYRALSQLTDKMQKNRKTGQFFDRVAKNIKLDDQGISFGKAGRIFSNPDEEKYVKYVNSLLTGAKEQFGARVTNFDVQAFLSQHPNLWQSEQGRKDIIETLQIMNDLNLTSSQLVSQALADTKGNVNPHVLDQRIEQEMAPQIAAAQAKLDEIMMRASYDQPTAEGLEGAEEVKTIKGKKYARVGDQWYEYTGK